MEGKSLGCTKYQRCLQTPQPPISTFCVQKHGFLSTSHGFLSTLRSMRSLKRGRCEFHKTIRTRGFTVLQARWTFQFHRFNVYVMDFRVLGCPAEARVPIDTPCLGVAGIIAGLFRHFLGEQAVRGLVLARNVKNRQQQCSCQAGFRIRSLCRYVMVSEARVPIDAPAEAEKARVPIDGASLY